MADTEVLRKRLESRIADLHAQLADAEADLKAVDRVEKIEASLERGPQIVRADPSVKVRLKKTVIDLCREIASSALPTMEWTVSSMTPEVHRLGRPDATRDNVATSMTRLHEMEFWVKVRKELKLGNVYVREPKANAVT